MDTHLDDDPVAAEYERRLDYYAALREAERTGRTAASVQEEWRLDAQRQTVLGHDATTLADKEAKLEQAKTKLEEAKQSQREAVATWQGMLKQRGELTTRIAELTATIPTAASIRDRRELCKFELRRPYDRLRDYIFDGHLAWLTQTEVYRGLVEETLAELGAELADLEKSIAEFAKAHNIEISAPAIAGSRE